MTDPAAVALATALHTTALRNHNVGEGPQRAICNDPAAHDQRAESIIAALPGKWALVEVPEWHDGSMESELALLFAKARTHGDVYMDGSHNPLPSEYIAAHRFMDALVERVAEGLYDAFHDMWPVTDAEDPKDLRAEARRLLGIEEEDACTKCGHKRTSHDLGWDAAGCMVGSCHCGGDR